MSDHLKRLMSDALASGTELVRGMSEPEVRAYRTNYEFIPQEAEFGAAKAISRPHTYCTGKWKASWQNGREPKLLPFGCELVPNEAHGLTLLRGSWTLMCPGAVRQWRMKLDWDTTAATRHGNGGKPVMNEFAVADALALINAVTIADGQGVFICPMNLGNVLLDEQATYDHHRQKGHTTFEHNVHVYRTELISERTILKTSSGTEVINQLRLLVFTIDLFGR